MKVVIDARFYGIAHTGIGRYVENLIKHLPASVILIVTPKDYHRPELARFPKIISHTHPYSLLSQFEIPYLLLTTHCSLFHVPFSSIPIFWPGRLIVTFHDLIKHLSKGSDTTTHNRIFYWIKYLGYRTIDFIALKRATSIVVPTQYWKKVITAKYHLKNVFVTYEAVDDNFIKLKPQPVPGLQKPFLVYTGNLYPHKNLDVLLRAMRELNLRLYLICARSVFAKRAEEKIKQLGVESKVFFLGRLSDAEIKYVYHRAEALVFPSKIEGFGLNGLEAMACGLPVVASNASCLPEVYGEAALYFDPDNPSELVNQIKLLPKYRHKLIRLGRAQVRKYSFAKMAQQTWEIYQNALP